MTLWGSLFHNVFGVAYVRLFLIFSIPFVYRIYLNQGVDSLFLRLNAGHTQKDVWDSIEKRCQELRDKDTTDDT